MSSEHHITKETSAAVFGLILLVALVAADFSLLGVGRKRRNGDAIIVRLLYTAYFVLFGYLMHWASDNFNKQCVGDKCTVSFHYHPTFMSVAWVFFASEGIMAYKVKPVAGTSHSTAKAYHAFMNVMAFIFAITGVSIAFRNHQVKGVPHLDSVHSWVGFTTTFIMFIQVVMGLFVYYISSNTELKAKMMLGHRFVGALAYTMAVGTISLGLMDYEGDGDYSKRHKVVHTAMIVLWVQALHVLANLLT
eukprot:m.50067 g.50067  ORF g.50067 m.50067 type:complete len:248 (+) comp13390_c0_seq1:88-831(+)